MTELRLPGRHRFTPFPVGAKGVGIEIIAANAIPELGALKARYTVRYECCGKEAIMTHNGITSRLRYQSVRCHVCASKAANERRWALHKDLTLRQQLRAAKKSKARIKEDALKIAISGKWND